MRSAKYLFRPQYVNVIDIGAVGMRLYQRENGLPSMVH